MKLSVFGISFPKGMAMTNRITLYCKAMQESKKDIDITIFSDSRESVSGVYEGIKYQTLKKKTLFNERFSYYLRPLLIWDGFLKATKNTNAVLIAREGVFTTVIMFLISRLRGFKIIQELNENLYLPYGNRFSPLWMAKLKTWMCLHTSFKLLDGFICISQPLRDLVIKYNKKAKVIVIPILCEDKGGKYDPDLNNPYVFNAGCTSIYKDGYHAVLEGFGKACLKTWNMRFYQTIYAATKIEDSLYKSIIEKYNIKASYNILGFLSKNEVDEYRKHTLLAIMNKPSNWQNDYNFPTKLGEYMINGIPIIATSTGALGEYLVDGVNAYIIKENDSDGICSAICDIVSDMENAKEIGRSGRETALKYFYYKNHTDVISEFIVSFQ